MRSLFYLARDLLTHPGPIPKVLRRTLIRTLRKAHDREDALAIERLEAERQRLLDSSETVSASGRSLAEVCAASSKKRFWCRLLFNTVRVARPACGLELGTCLGISAAYQATAMQRNGAGRLITVEKNRRYCRVAEELFGNLALENVEIVNDDFTSALPDLLSRHRFDYVFIDGHKSGTALYQYFDTIAAHSPGNAVIMLDDIRWSKDMHAAWHRIRQDPRVASSIDLGQMGLVLRAGDDNRD